MPESTTVTQVPGGGAPWSPPAQAAPSAGRTGPPSWDRAIPFIGPVLLFIVWDLAVRFGFIKPILLPPPAATLVSLVNGLAGGPLLNDFAMTLWRTAQAFLIAAVLGVPLGVVLGSNVRAYRSVEFLVDFFRSTPSSALIPLFLMIF
ncbi:ABC transporter permease, partial [Roseateles sp. GG27B]